MKKNLLIAISLTIVAGIVFLARMVAAPSKEASSFLSQLDGVTAGKTTEAELLAKPAFQNLPRRCNNSECSYDFHAENLWLSRLHLAASAEIVIQVTVQDGLVVHVRSYGAIVDKKSMSLVAVIQDPSRKGCGANPCIRRASKPPQRYNRFSFSSVTIEFNGDSNLRNQVSQAFNPSCLSRWLGCRNVDELIPLIDHLQNAISLN
jgi:hypothetical protein